MANQNAPVPTKEEREYDQRVFDGVNAGTYTSNTLRKYIAALATVEDHRDAVYYERNRIVAALAKCFPSGVVKGEEWHCVYIDLPTGQVSWHFNNKQAHLFEGLPPYTQDWDEHDTEEKYKRVGRLHRHGA